MPKVREITAPSGKVYKWTRPPRHVHWRHGRSGQTFLARMEEIANDSEEAMTDAEKGIRLFESYSPAEAAKLEAYVTEVVSAGLGVKPDDLDIPDVDFWYLFGQSVYAVPETVVETKEGETTAQTVESFPPLSSIPDSSSGMSEVPSESSGGDGDSRSVAA